MSNKPETYWEQRCFINEQILDDIVSVIGNSLPSTQQRLESICTEWDKAINKLEEVYK